LKTFKNNFSKFVLFNIRNPKNFKEDKNAENTIILSKILKEIHAIGVNLNQTQHFLNTKKDQLHQISIKKLQGKIDSIHIELESIKKKITHDH
jgi:cob(I)alamin adenosyltransferase